MKKEFTQILVNNLNDMEAQIVKIVEPTEKVTAISNYINTFINVLSVVPEKDLLDTMNFLVDAEDDDDNVAKDTPEEEVEETTEEAEEEAVGPEIDDDPLEDADAQEVILAEDEEGNMIEVTDAFYYVKNNQDESLERDFELEDLALYITECNCLEQYKQFKALQHGYDRAMIAAALKINGQEFMDAKVQEFTNLDDVNVFEVVDDNNAEAIYDFIYPEED